MGTKVGVIMMNGSIEVRSWGACSWPRCETAFRCVAAIKRRERQMNLLQAAAMFTHMESTMDHIEHHCLEEGAKILQEEAKRELGQYQPGWPQLKPETIARKATGDSPLLETGDLRDSIEREVQHDAAYVGSNSKKAVWHELGTSRIPPRPFLGTAAAAKHAEIGEMIGAKFHALLIKG
jgi:phage gpG-like protein